MLVSTMVQIASSRGRCALSTHAEALLQGKRDALWWYALDCNRMHISEYLYYFVSWLSNIYHGMPYAKRERSLYSSRQSRTREITRDRSEKRTRDSLARLHAGDSNGKCMCNYQGRAAIMPVPVGVLVKACPSLIS
jgi:hypothetical protein